MSVDAATVRRIAHLARIAVTEAEVPHLQGELNAMLAFVEQRRAVPPQAIEHTVRSCGLLRDRGIGQLEYIEAGAVGNTPLHNVCADALALRQQAELADFLVCGKQISLDTSGQKFDSFRVGL